MELSHTNLSEYGIKSFGYFRHLVNLSRNSMFTLH